MSEETLIPKHGGYRNLKSFQVAQLVFDLTVRFCERYVSKFSRTTDQMVQAARSGVQNIAEGSQASGTSKKTELKLTNVARASLEELKLDYEDFLRQRSLPLWERQDPRRAGLIARRCKTADEVAAWVKEQHCGQENLGGLCGQNHGRHGQDTFQSTQSTPLSTTSNKSSYPEIAANAALTLLSVACALLDRQLEAQAKAFETEGGFTERLYKIRTQKRSLQSTKSTKSTKD
ncbi:MAG: four helix bundle suffix domain-containing protein [Desulfuromonadales bacterium]